MELEKRAERRFVNETEIAGRTMGSIRRVTPSVCVCVCVSVRFLNMNNSTNTWWIFTNFFLFWRSRVAPQFSAVAWSKCCVGRSLRSIFDRSTAFGRQNVWPPISHRRRCLIPENVDVSESLLVADNARRFEFSKFNSGRLWRSVESEQSTAVKHRSKFPI